MARTKVQDANEAVLAAADAWFESPDFIGGLDALLDAVKARREAIAAQSLDDPEVYVRNDAHTSEREAAARAMIARPGYRRLVYNIIRVGGPVSDRGIEYVLWSNSQRGVRKMFDVEFPPQGLPHQTLSSARKSLVDCGLVYADGHEKINGRKHILWRARPLPEGTT